jgi:hypothetical protein
LVRVRDSDREREREREREEFNEERERRRENHQIVPDWLRSLVWKSSDFINFVIPIRRLIYSLI